MSSLLSEWSQLANTQGRWPRASVEAFRNADPTPESMSLSGYMRIVTGVIQKYAPQAVWITAEVASVSAKGGHRYIDLIEYDEYHKEVAKAKLTVWKFASHKIAQFESDTGVEFKSGIKILVQVKAVLHAAYGFSLNLEQIDSRFTLGVNEAKLKKIRQRLIDSGDWARNRQLSVPNDFFRVAVLSPSNAAGLADFRQDADPLQSTGVCEFLYFSSTFQGESAKKAIPAALLEISQHHSRMPFDCVVVIRGGGAKSDLSSLDEFEIVQSVCLMPIPVLVGIGHQIDHVMLDEVATKSFDTPSKVIKHIVSEISKRCDAVQASMNTIRDQALRQYERRLAQITKSNTAVKTSARFTVEKRERHADRYLAEIRSHALDLVVGMETNALGFYRDCADGAHRRLTVASTSNDHLFNMVKVEANKFVAEKSEALEKFYQAVGLRSLEAVRVKDLHVEGAKRKIRERGLDAVSGQIRRSDELIAQSLQSAQRVWTRRKQRVDQLMQSIVGLGPRPTLRRGFALVRDNNGAVIKNVEGARIAGAMNVEFADGRVDVVVDTQKGKLND